MTGRFSLTPTDEQARVMALARHATRPIAWLGTVRAGKTVGAVMALMERLKSYPGDYAVTVYSSDNLERNIIPIIERILDDNDEFYRRRKSPPRMIQLLDGSAIHFYIAGDKGTDKALQGVTLRGAVSDEVLLCDREFLMQLVARFSQDNPFWIMTANKTNPGHWIKTEWIDEGLVEIVESTHLDNPHISQDAKGWWNLMTGHQKTRMLDNEWAHEFAPIGGRLHVVETAEEPDATAMLFRTCWIDLARGFALAEGWVAPDRSTMHIDHVYTFGSIEELVIASNSDPCKTYCNTPAGGAFPDIAQCTFVTADMAQIGSRAAERWLRVSLAPWLDKSASRFGNWAWEATGRPCEAAPETLAIALAMYSLLAYHPATIQRQTL